MSPRILVADDERSVRQLLELVLSQENYEVTVVQNGDELVRAAQAQVPDLVIIDLMMPMMDGYEAIRQLRNDTRTAHLPMIILTAKSAPGDVVTGFETGADDYVTKPFNIPELLARIKSLLRRATAQPVRSPLTGLPGNVLLTEEIKYRYKSTGSFALLYIDLDNFKAFNDTYGPARGDRVIKLVAELLVEVVQQQGTGADFIGHIGGDDFAVLTVPEAVQPICSALIAAFDERVRALYDASDLERGHLVGIDRQGIPRRFPIISLSIGVVTDQQRTFQDHEEISRVAAEMKAFAKQQPGSSFAIDSRSDDSQALAGDRRGTQVAGILLASSDPELRSGLAQALLDEGYRVFEAPGLPEAHALLAREPRLALVVADAALGDELRELTISMVQPDQPATLVLSRSAADEEPYPAETTVQFLRQPVAVAQLVERVEYILARTREA